MSIYELSRGNGLCFACHGQAPMDGSTPPALEETINLEIAGLVLINGMKRGQPNANCLWL